MTDADKTRKEMHDFCLENFTEKINSKVDSSKQYKESITLFCVDCGDVFPIEEQVLVVKEHIDKWANRCYPRAFYIDCLWHIYKNDIDESFWENISKKTEMLFE